MDMVILTSVVALSVIGGYLLCLMLTDRANKPVGVLRVDRSDPDDGPYFFLELTDDSVNKILHSDKVMLDVKMANFLDA